MGAYRAELYIGKVKKTKGQVKKHVSQMTREELFYLKKQIRLFPTWKIHVSTHLKRKQVSFNLNDMIDVLLSSNVQDLIVEYNETLNHEGRVDHRVLIRSTKARKVKFYTKGQKTTECMAHLCFVISLDTYEVVTAYWNKVSDDHENIDWRRYNQHLRIIK